MARDGTMIGLAPLDKSPAIMADRARQVASQFGYPAPPADRAGWYEVDEEYVRERGAGARPTESKRQIWSSEPGAWRFVYRQSPRPLATLDPIVQVNRFDPPNDLPGMLTVILDAHGRLLRFSAVPTGGDENPAPAAFDWAPVLSGTGLNEVASASPAVIPRGTFDSVSAWSGTLGEDRIHIVAATYRGRPTYYEVFLGQAFRTRESAPEPGRDKTTTWPEPIIYLSVVAVAFFLARRNMRAGRVDRTGAAKLAAFVFAVVFLQRVFMTHFVGNAAQLRAAIVYGTGVALGTSLAMVYLSYLALEPYFRRRWPRMMISWSRVLAGRFSDARVGADLVTGIAAGVVMAAGALLPFALTTWLNLAGQIPFFNRKNYNMVESVTTTALRGFDGILLNLLSMVSFGVVIAMLLASVLLLARLLLRRDPLAALALGSVAFGVFYKIFDTSGIMPVIGVTCAALLAALAVLVLFRFGLLALAVSLFVGSLVQGTFLPLDFSRWYVWSPVVTLAVLAGLALHGLRAALAGRPAFGRVVLED
jgi:serine/threonine-protein kinase